MSEKRIHILRQIAIVLVLSLVLVSSVGIKTVNAQAGQETLKASDDTYVDFIYQNSNYGEQYYLQIQYSQDYPLLGAFWPRSIVWVKFNLSSVPDGAVVDIAALQLHTSSVNVTYDVHAYSGDSSWNESTLTYGNIPAFWNNTSMDSVSVTTNNQWYNWSVVDAVRNALNNNSTAVTIVLSAPLAVDSLSGIWFDSKENLINSTDYSPKLTIHWSNTVPEFPTFICLPFFVLATLIGVTLYKKKAMQYRRF